MTSMTCTIVIWIEMALSFGAPTDPAYTRFLEGLRSVVADPVGKRTWRWDGGDQKWYAYAPDKWGFEDFGAPDTPPEGAVTEHWNLPQSTWEVHDLWVPGLFDRLQKAFTKLSRSYPTANLVWSPWGGGDWRSAFKRAGPLPKPPKPDEKSGKKVDLPQKALESIEQVKEYERRKIITHDQAQKMIASIVAEYT